MGPGFAEMEIEERPSEPVIIFMADKTSSGRLELAALQDVRRPVQHHRPGDRPEHARRLLPSRCSTSSASARSPSTLPEEMYDMLVFIGAPSRYVIKHVFPQERRESVAVSSTQKLSLMAGRYVGKDDPVMHRPLPGRPSRPSARCSSPSPSPTLVAGWMRGSHHGPLMPVGVRGQHADPLRRPAPRGRPRLPAHRRQAGRPARHVRRQVLRQRPPAGAGRRRLPAPPRPVRAAPLPLEEMEYTTMPEVMKKLKAASSRSTRTRPRKIGVKPLFCIFQLLMMHHWGQAPLVHSQRFAELLS